MQEVAAVRGNRHVGLGLALYAIFFGSGTAALIYQVCWQRMLSVYYGVGAISIALVVSAFMLGLGLGALAGGHLVRRAASPLKLYAAVEVGIALFGVTSLPLLGRLGEATAGAGYALTFVCAFAVLLVPTMLMGMTLPIAIGAMRRYDPDILRDTTSYYFANTLGASAGALVCGYALLSLYGISGAIKIAAALNILLAAALFLVVRGDGAVARIATPAGVARPRRLVLLLLMANGFLAIGYQIVWYRVAAVLLKDSAYSFSTILAIYLLGIGLGSLWLHRRGLRRWAGHEFDFYLLLNALIGISAISAVLLLYVGWDNKPLATLIRFSQSFDILPWIGNPADWSGREAYRSTAISLMLIAFWPALLLLVPTFLMGAAFPVGIALAAQDGDEQGASLGYASTIAGNTLGGIVTQFILLPAFGTTAVFAGFCMLQGILLLLVRRRSNGEPSSRWLPAIGVSAMALAILVAPLATDFYRRIHPSHPDKRMHFAEGLEGVAMVFDDGKTLNNIINGSSHGTRPGGGYVHEALVALAYLEAPRDVLVIGYGAGALVEALLADDRLKSITVVELNKTAFDNLMKIDALASRARDPRLTFVFDDGRRFLHRAKHRYDLISMDPIRSRSGFSNNLYSKDFFELAGRALNPGGALLVWCGDDWTGGVRKSLATAFPQVELYSYFMVASNNRLQFSRPLYDALARTLPANVAADMRPFDRPRVGDRSTILQATRDVPVNTDTAPYSEFFLGSLLRPLPRWP
ncbi:MAG: hypothetical protein JNM79_05770 [Burkholderiales bacterium]|nr:hypothetical protein [Burkholderiales bacterium]